MSGVYIFYRTIKVFIGYEISENECINYSMIVSWIKKIGEFIGMEIPTILYNLRYNVDNMFDKSSAFYFLYPTNYFR